MDAAQRSRKAFGYAILLAGLTASAILLVAPSRTAKSSRPARASYPPANPSAEIQRRLESMEAQISALKSGALAQQPAPPTPPPSVVTTSVPPAPGTAPVLTEEESAERLQQEIERRYALLERRFAEEPGDDSGSMREEQGIRERIQVLQGYELSKLECRYTMCRLEVTVAAANAADVLSRLGFVEGGEIRRRQDGSFLVFAGREGFPFQEVNRVN